MTTNVFEKKNYFHIDNGGISTELTVDENAIFTMKIETSYYGYPSTEIKFTGVMCNEVLAMLSQLSQDLREVVNPSSFLENEKDTQNVEFILCDGTESWHTMIRPVPVDIVQNGNDAIIEWANEELPLHNIIYVGVFNLNPEMPMDEDMDE